jgi:hypothetical protein
VNSTPKTKAEGLANGASSQLQAAATIISGSDHSSKLANVTEQSLSGGTLPDSVAKSFLSGVVSDGARSTSPRGGPHAWEHLNVAFDLQANRERAVFSSHPRDAHPAVTTRSHPAVLYSQHTVNPLQTSSVYSTPSFHHTSPLSSMIAQPADPRGPHTSPEPMQSPYLYEDVGGQSPALACPGNSQHDSIPILAAAARMHSGSSVLDPVTPQPSLAPLPSMYWFLFDNDDNSVGPRKDASRSPSKLLGNADIIVPAPRPAANPMPISFLARWEDMLALEHRIRSSFDTNLQQMKQVQPTEADQAKQGGDQEVSSLKESGKFCSILFYFFSFPGCFGYCGRPSRDTESERLHIH